MPIMDKFKPGTFCWVELAANDSKAAKKFYEKVFDWDFDDQPMGEDAFYTMLRRKGKDAGGMYQLTKEMKSHGIPPHWLSYVAVENTDEVAKKAKSLGANIVKEPFDVMEVGRMAAIVDPTGAAFALWQAKAHHGSAIVNEHGAPSWNELLTKDVDRAGKFYTELFGWTADTRDMGGFQYTSFMNGDRPAGGMMAITAEMELPTSVWMVYFGSDDADKMAQAVKQAGGQIVDGPRDIPEIGRFAVAIDPQGAAFAFIKALMPAS